MPCNDCSRAETCPPCVSQKDHAQDLRDSIAEIVADFVPTTEAQRTIADLDKLVDMIRQPREN